MAWPAGLILSSLALYGFIGFATIFYMLGYSDGVIDGEGPEIDLEEHHG